MNRTCSETIINDNNTNCTFELYGNNCTKLKIKKPTEKNSIKIDKGLQFNEIQIQTNSYKDININRK